MRWQIIFLILSVLSFEGDGQSFQSLLDSAVTSKERSILYFGEAQKKIQTADDSLNFLFAKTNRSYRDKRQDSTLYYGKRFLRHAGIDQVPEQCFLIC